MSYESLNVAFGKHRDCALAQNNRSMDTRERLCRARKNKRLPPAKLDRRRPTAIQSRHGARPAHCSESYDKRTILFARSLALTKNLHEFSLERPRWRPWTRCVVLALLTALPACQKSESPLPPAPAAEEAGNTPARESWEAFYLQNAKVGYGQTAVRPIVRAGQELVQLDSLNHLAISRFGQQTEHDARIRTLETPAGQVVEFRTEIAFGPSPVIVTGHVDGPEMVIETQTKGRRDVTRIAWSSEIRGFHAVEQSLEQEPLRPAQQRTFKMLMPLINQIAEVELSARDYEMTSVLGIQTKLLKIESIAHLPDDQTIESTLWTDGEGRTIKTRVAALEQESYRTSRELALAAGTTGATIDLGSDLTVKLDRPFPQARQSRLARYRVELASGDPAKIFASGVTQSVRSLDAHTAEVTVRSLRPGDAAAAPSSVLVAHEYTVANSVLQIDDPRVRAMAREAQGNAMNPRQSAIALERYVHQAMTKKNFSQAFATAAEVAESREGDCTEHAVLLAALARACGIPSRVAIGLVYLESLDGFGYHMWTEMYLDGQWCPLDAIMGQGGIGAGYLKLTDSSLDGASAYSSFLPVAQVVGQLKISLLTAE